MSSSRILARAASPGGPQPGVRELVRCIPLAPPVDIGQELERLGYKGHARQRSMLALMAYRHVRRLKRIHLEEIPREGLPPKQNMLLLGPTGCGKTFMVELVFERLLGVPTLIADATSLTESGYIGDDTRTVLARLFDRAGGDPRWAECGVICLDEFDKLAGASSNARFAGAGTTKDVSGYGVQRELLTLIGGSDVVLQGDRGFGRPVDGTTLSTRDIPFIACGAFSGLDRNRASGPIGFNAAPGTGKPPAGAPGLADFQRYGFIPELLGRFTSTVVFPALDRAALKSILADNVLPRYRHEFASEGITLTVSPDALDHIAGRALARQTGARGLQSEMVGLLETAAYELFMQHRRATLDISVRKHRLALEIGQPVECGRV